MDTPVLDPIEQAKRVRAIAESEANNHDEVWDGVYLVSPSPNDEHQEIVMNLGTVFTILIGWTGLGLVRPGVNVSDIEDQWEHSYRSSDVVVYHNGTTARNLGTHWVGGPDFCVVIVSRNDRSRDKLDFYAKVGTRELLVVDRFLWGLELYRLQDGVLTRVGESTLGQPNILISEVLPLTFRLVEGDPRPKIEVVHADGVQRWSA
jgi:Uma2 family endonuclease